MPKAPPRFHVTAFASMAFLSSAAAIAAGGVVEVTRFLPDGFVRDGSVSYAAEIQAAIDAAAREGAALEFPEMVYAADEVGWELRSRTTLRLGNAEFRLGEACAKDGAVFHGKDVSDVTVTGGAIIGRNDVWQDGVNIRGIHLTGRCAGIRISGLRCRDLSSNGIGIFGGEDGHARDVWIRDVVVENCCKRYPDYLSKESSEKGSVREDQGDVALYFVEDFLVEGCRFERSRSDGTHFYRCRNGQITDNRIHRAKMGGYFLETCEAVVGRGNVMLGNGSRGATIERGSIGCVFSGNVVRGSGREGLWAPDCIGLVVTGNIFDRNGLKPNGPEARFIWNANITVNESHKDPTESPTRDYLIADNLICTSTNQVAAIRVDTTGEVGDIVIQNNVLLGENRQVLIEGPTPDVVRVADNGGE